MLKLCLEAQSLTRDQGKEGEAPPTTSVAREQRPPAAPPRHHVVPRPPRQGREVTRPAR